MIVSIFQLLPYYFEFVCTGVGESLPVRKARGRGRGRGTKRTKQKTGQAQAGHDKNHDQQLHPALAEASSDSDAAFVTEPECMNLYANARPGQPTFVDLGSTSEPESAPSGRGQAHVGASVDAHVTSRPKPEVAVPESVSSVPKTPRERTMGAAPRLRTVEPGNKASTTLFSESTVWYGGVPILKRTDQGGAGSWVCRCPFHFVGTTSCSKSISLARPSPEVALQRIKWWLYQGLDRLINY